MAEIHTLTPPPQAVRAAAGRIGKPAAPDDGQADATDGYDTGEDAAMGVARDQLRSLVERIERLEEEKASTVTDIKDVYAEAKGVGFDVKVLRKVIALRKQDQNERMEQEAVLDLYLHALGMK